ncbi:HXXEE domain-containing protein [Conyzicola nivalis]|uniref:Beta-carotene 15,15'-monooxygenase n=1 Tax=Conyzicola nivalis TaxID=1477021 RepID=A0A916SJQ5_9MICO|nr:HXXEE domain-containing protein [Conyzicola nivalis]GGB02592.1 beta-carotene 15,15'-monooxygenase [Conyzicola nivalis]
MTAFSNPFWVRVAGQWWITTVYLLGGLALALVLIFGSTWEMPRIVAALFAVTLALHVLEELNWPAGFHYMLNSVQKSKTPEIGPENRLSDLITNLGVQVLIIGVVIVGGNIATTIAFLIFGIGEAVVHLLFGFIIHRKLKPRGKRTIYGPGTVSALVGFLPVAIIAWVWLGSQSIGGWDIAIAILIIAVMIGVLIRLPMIVIDGRKYPELAYKSLGYFTKFVR